MDDSKNKIYLKGKKDSSLTGGGVEKSRNNFLSFLFILFVIIVFFISPLPKYLISLVPDEFAGFIMSSVYEDIVLNDNFELLVEPRKYSPEGRKLLNVLGHNSGICFFFRPNIVDKNILSSANKGKIIAEVIAVSTKKKDEYILDNVTVSNSNNYTIICQKFGSYYSFIPDKVRAVYVRPLSKLALDKVKWITMKDL